MSGDSPMNIRRQDTLNPFLRWRWEVDGMFGYAATKRGAASAARRAMLEARR